MNLLLAVAFAAQAQTIVPGGVRSVAIPGAASFIGASPAASFQAGKPFPGSLMPSMTLKSALPSVAPIPKTALPVSAIPAMVLNSPVQIPSSKDVSAKETLVAGAAGLEKASKQGNLAAASNSFFHGAAMSAPLPGGPESSLRSPNGQEDARINQAFSMLQNTQIGGAIYQDALKNYGATLRIFIDDSPNAKYDARVAFNGTAPTLVLTRGLVNEQSLPVIAAYAARELSDLYYDYFPRSAERSYMAYGNMARVYAELTNSDLAGNNHSWDTRDDQRSGNAYAMYSYYSEWKKAVLSGDARSSSFFSFLRTSDDSHAEPEAKLTLWEQYNRGMITYQQYRDRDEEFGKSVAAEGRWLQDTDRL